MVSLPPMEEQIKIAQFFYLSQQEQKLLEELKYHRAILSQGILMLMVSESRKTASNKKPGCDVAISAPGQTQSRARN